MKELIIDSNTKLSKIEDKESITKLIIKTKVNPNKLKGFINIKDLTLERYDEKSICDYNENNINKFPFKDKVEKLTFINIENYGRFKNINKQHYCLKFPNLKSVEFLGETKINWISRYYLYDCENLESILFNPLQLKKYSSSDFRLSSMNLKKIIISLNNKKNEVNIDYPINSCELFDLNCKNVLKYSNGNIYTQVSIENDELTKMHILKFINKDNLLENTIIIPDYITNLEILDYYNIDKFDSISFNLNLLKTQKEKANIVFNMNLKNLKKIIIRSNNNMSLFEITEIFIENDLKELYIENNKLHIVYPDKVIIIDKNGKKIIKEYVVKINNKEAIDELFNKYNLDELKEYLYYKELLELVKKYNDEEIDNAMELVGEKIIKRLTK